MDKREEHKQIAEGSFCASNAMIGDWKYIEVGKVHAVIELLDVGDGNKLALRVIAKTMRSVNSAMDTLRKSPSSNDDWNKGARDMAGIVKVILRTVLDDDVPRCPTDNKVTTDTVKTSIEEWIALQRTNGALSLGMLEERVEKLEARVTVDCDDHIEHLDAYIRAQAKLAKKKKKRK